jgi:hypothetical protein
MLKEAGSFFAIALILLVGACVYIESQGGSPFAIHASGQSVQPAQGDSVVGSPTISADFINQVLTKYGSPAAGTGQDLYDLGQQYNIDPAFALAVFWNESNFGRNGEAAVTRSLGNLRPVPGEAFERDGYAVFYTWQDGYKAFYKLVSGPLYVGCGLTTPSAIMPRYAPSGDNNDPSHYTSVVESAMSIWKAGKVEVP